MMENNIFADLIPGNQASIQTPIDPNNPFADLIPKQPSAPPDTSPQWAQSLADSAPVNAILGAGDATQNMLANLVNLVPGVHAPLAKSSEGLAYDLGNIGGHIANYALPMGATTKALLAAKSIPALGGVAESLLANTIPGAIGKNAIASAGYGALMNPQSRGESAAIEGALGGAGGALGQALSKLAPTNLFRTNISPEKLAENLDVARGTSTGLGDIIESPFLKRQYENILPKILGSDADNIMQKTAAQVTNKGKELLNQMLGNNSPADVGRAFQDALKNAQKEAMRLKQTNYSEVNKLADEMGIKIGRDNFSKQAADILEDVKASSELSREMPSKLINDLQEYSKPENVNNLKLTNIFRGKLGDKATEAYQNGNMYEYGIYKNLKNALQDDIEASIPRDAANPLRQKYDAAQNFYREKIAPLEDPAITKFTREGGDSDLLLSSFVKTGNQDRGNLLRKLSDNLPEHPELNLKGMLPYGFFSRAIENGELNPLKMRTLYKSLGPTQREILLSQPGMAKSMADYSKLVGMNTEPLTQMFNAKTGQRALDVIPGMLTSGLGAGMLYGLPGLIGMAAISRGISKGLTSESAREKFVQKMLQNKSPAINKGDLGAAIATALGQQFQ